MKRTQMLIYALLLFFFIVGEAIASLSFLPNDGLVLDDKGDQDITNDQFWIADLSLLTNMTYAEQIGGIQSWNATGSQFYNALSTPWHMASATEMQELLSYSDDEIMKVFLPSGIGAYTNATATLYSGRYDSLIQYCITPTHEVYSIHNIVGQMDLRDLPWSVWLSTQPSDDTRYLWGGAWVTATYAPTTVPIPPSIFLMITSLISLIAIRCKSDYQYCFKSLIKWA